ncbi:MAG: arylesterase [Methylophilaceae bacterium]
MRCYFFKWLAVNKFSVHCLLVISLILTSLVALPASAKEKNPNSQTIVVFGDSLSAGYGLAQNQGWVTLMQARVAQQKLSYQVVNASISGETTSGGLARFKQMLATHQPHIVILELGGNDGLRGLPINEMHANLNAMIVQAKATKAKILLLGMQIPPNYGKKYTQAFSETYPLLAKQHSIQLVPFLLKGVAGKRDLIQNDGIHPLAIAQPQLLNNVWDKLNLMIQP